MGKGGIDVLIVEDEAAHAEAISRAFKAQSPGVKIQVVSTLQEYRWSVAANPPDIVLMDMNLPDGRATDVLNHHVGEDRAFPLLIMTAYGNEELAVEAMKNGAFDYIVKSSETFARMPKAVQSALREWNLRQKHQQIESALRESEDRFRTLLQEVPAIACQGYAMDGTVLYWNQASEKFYGYTADEAIGRNMIELIIPPAEREKVKAALELMVATGQAIPAAELRLLRKDGTRVDVYSSHVVLQNPGRAPELFCLDVDITERKRYEIRLEHLATHDELTGLANRALLQDRLAQSLHYAHRSGRLVAVLLLDLDRFKVFNDSLGHDFGDQLLCAVAERLLLNVREADTVARMGGDEFVVLLAEVASEEDVGLVARKLLDQLNFPYQIGGREITVTASLGISLYPKDSSDGSTLIRNADMAMYRAKKHDSSNFSFYSPELNQRVVETLELEGALRQALERQEFCLHYQPKVDLASGRVVGCEALVRWHHPQRGMVSPADFIPLAEETGLIVPLGSWVLREACRQNRAWQAEGLPPMSVAVNLSARQFRKGDLPQLVQNILQEVGLDPRYLELELTESMVMDDPRKAEGTMLALKKLGVGLSLDDFGTGYSSLNYLRRFPVDSLKIDRSFINDVITDPSGASVVTSVIDIAHNLGLIAVAEGVETDEQLAFLAGCGCDIYQGYLFSRPLPASAFAELVQGQARLLEAASADACPPK
ncbi:MAG: EAL domain-containing protein [Desulfuromonadales bacterium]|nr:EAL domain-containing protein [Desulfuromonadales bacterium]